MPFHYLNASMSYKLLTARGYNKRRHPVEKKKKKKRILLCRIGLMCHLY